MALGGHHSVVYKLTYSYYMGYSIAITLQQDSLSINHHETSTTRILLAQYESVGVYSAAIKMNHDQIHDATRNSCSDYVALIPWHVGRRKCCVI